jgi:hypothetical protein
MDQAPNRLSVRPLSTSTFSVVYFRIDVIDERPLQVYIAIAAAENVVFVVFGQRRTRGSRHRLLIRRRMATSIIEIFGAGKVNDPICRNWRRRNTYLKS